MTASGNALAVGSIFFRLLILKPNLHTQYIWEGKLRWFAKNPQIH